MARPHRDTVDDESPGRHGESSVQVVARPSRGATGGDDDIALAGTALQRGDNRVQIVRDVFGRNHLGTHADEPPGQLGAKRVAHSAVARDPAVLQFIAEEHEPDSRSAYDGDRIMARRGEKSGQRGGDVGAGLSDEVADSAFFAGSSDVQTRRGWCPDNSDGESGVLPSNDRAGALGHDGTSGDADCGT